MSALLARYRLGISREPRYRRKVPAIIVVSQDWLQQIMPESSTAAIFFAEVVKLDDRLDEAKLVWLKLQTVMLMNARLANPRLALTPESLAIVCHFVAHSYVMDDKAGVTTHLTGLLSMLQLMGGLAALDQSPLAKVLAIWAIALSTAEPAFENAATKPARRLLQSLPSRMVFDSTTTIEHNMALNCGRGSRARFNPFHMFRVALQPLQSNLTWTQVRHHLAISVGHPIHTILFIQAALLDVVDAISNNNIAPSAAALALQSLSHKLVTNKETMDHSLPCPPFSRADSDLNQYVTDCASLCTLVVTLQALVFVEPRRSHLHEMYQALSALHALLDAPTNTTLELDIWILFTVIPLSTQPRRRQDLLARLFASCMQLRLTSWAQTRVLLEAVFWCGVLQDQSGIGVFREVQSRFGVVRGGQRTDRPP